MGADWLSKLFKSGAGELVGKVGEAVEKVSKGHLGRKELELELAKLLAQRDSDVEETLREEIAGRVKVIVAELQQDDKYTKRARPTLLYSGIVLAFFQLAAICAFTYAEKPMPDLAVMGWFFVPWGGGAATYIVKRSREKSDRLAGPAPDLADRVLE